MIFKQRRKRLRSKEVVALSGLVFVFLFFIVSFFLNHAFTEKIAASTEGNPEDPKEIVIESLSDPDTKITMEENKIIVEDKEDSSDDESISLETDPNTVAASGDITITSPIQNQVTNNDLLIIAGEAPSGSLVDVIITNEDNNANSFSKHKGFTLNGTVTSDKDGYWAFVPSSDLANGHYSVYATIELKDNDDLVSSIVFFQIQQDNYSLIWLIIILLILVVFSYVVYKVYTYWKNNRSVSEDKNQKIQKKTRNTQKTNLETDPLKNEGDYDEADLNKDGVVDEEDVEQAQSKLIIDALSEYTSKKKKNKKKKSKKKKS